MNKALALAAMLLLLAAGVSAKNEPPASTTISASEDAVKSAMVARLTAHGFHIESDSPYQMVWVKEMNNGAGILAQAVAGNSNCAMPKQVLNFSFASQSDGILVVGTEQLDKATALCGRERINLDGKKNREAMVSFLADVKSKAEAQVKKQ
jgi:hypothetical protein